MKYILYIQIKDVPPQIIMRGLTAFLLIIGVETSLAQEDRCPTDWSVEKSLRHNDCHKFYKCVYGEPIEYTCPDDLFFNLESSDCDWPSNVNCNDRDDSTQTEPEATDSSSDPPTEETEVPVCEVEVWPEPDLPKEVEILPNGCPVDPHTPKLLPHAGDCKLFYYCVWGELVLSDCPDSLHFNSELQVCDLPADAGCAVSANKHVEARRKLLNEILA